MATVSKLLVLALAGHLALAAPPALAAGGAPSSVELQAVQARDYEHDAATLFPAVISVLQDSGYIIHSADRDTGLITAQASSQSQTTFNIFWGLGKKKQTPVVSAFIDQRAPKLTRVRLNFILSKTKNRIYGVSSADEEMITDPAVYRDAFNRIDQAIFLRTATDGAPTSAAPVLKKPN